MRPSLCSASRPDPTAAAVKSAASIRATRAAVGRGAARLRRLCLHSRQLARDDRALLRWLVLCLLVLGLTTVAMVSGLCYRIELHQIRLLCGPPFYMEAEAVQVELLDPLPTYLICLGITLYFGAVMMRARSWIGRTQLMLAACTALALPGLMCVLWDGVLNMAAPLLCVLLLWVCTTFIPFFRLQRSSAA